MKENWDDIRIIKYAVLITAVLIVLTLFLESAFAYNVEMRLGYKISENDEVYADGLRQAADSVLANAKKAYVVSQSTGVVAGLVFAGDVFDSMLVKFQGSGYILGMKQSGDENRFLIVLTNSTYDSVDRKYESVGKLLSTTFGYDFVHSSGNSLFLQLQYYSVDIVNSLFWQNQARLKVTNDGKDDKGITKISIEQVK